jgi:hypothetical protein
MSCSALPNTKHFVGIQETRELHGRPVIRVPTELIIPAVHVLDRHPIHDTLNTSFAPPDVTVTVTKPAYNHSLSSHNSVSVAVDEDSNHDINRREIKAVLDTLHVSYPTLNYLQYEDGLRRHGIHYLDIASMFEANFYNATVGMTLGAAHMFCHWIADELRRARSQSKSDRRWHSDDKVPNHDV